MEHMSGLDVGQPDVQLDVFALGSARLPRETLVTQIAKSMLESIRGGKLPVGVRLPSEPKLAEMFQVSRNTLREAIRLLIAQGVLESRKGIGTFVRSVGFSTWPVETGIEELASTTQIITSAGHVPGCRSYEFEIIPCPSDVAHALGLEKQAEVYRITRVRLADHNPVIVCVDYLAASLLPMALMQKFDGQGSLFAFLSTTCGLSIAVARAALKPVLPDDAIARALDVEPNEPLLLLKQTHFDGQNQPFLYSENYVNSSLFGYHVRRMPSSFFTSHPAHQLAPSDKVQ
jgi:GntR family transcriptional regulator